VEITPSAVAFILLFGGLSRVQGGMGFKAALKLGDMKFSWTGQLADRGSDRSVAVVCCSIL
jgi:hypothetical protein